MRRARICCDGDCWLDLADHVVRFITDPSSRTYVVAYPAGLELCRSYVAGDPRRFRRLLTEQLRVSDLR
jgi:hypothetical protein